MALILFLKVELGNVFLLKSHYLYTLGVAFLSTAVCQAQCWGWRGDPGMGLTSGAHHSTWSQE